MKLASHWPVGLCSAVWICTNMQVTAVMAQTGSGMTIIVPAAGGGHMTPKDGPGAGPNSWIGYTSGSNQATGSGSAVTAGTFNLASGQGAFVGAGTANQANGISALVIGGFDNRATAIDSVVIGGAGHRATGARSFIGGGGYNLVSGQWAAIVGGGRDGTASTPAGTNQLDNIAAGDYSFIGGGQGNRTNAFGDWGTIGGGFLNTASAIFSTVPGGQLNSANGDWGTVGGGDSNTASGHYSTVAGGAINTASGNVSTVAGGASNAASGDYSFAAGTRAKAMHHRSFVWGGSETGDTASLADGDFVVYAPSRIRLFAGALGTNGCEVGTGNVGGNLTCAGNIVAANIPPSDRSLKTAIVPVDAQTVLARVVELPIAEWSFTAVPGVRHIGPMAQDFHRSFGVGASDTIITTVDADGVALAAIQGLDAKLEQLQGLNVKLEAQVAAQQREIAQLRVAHERELAELRLAVQVLLARTAASGAVAGLH